MWSWSSCLSLSCIIPPMLTSSALNGLCQTHLEAPTVLSQDRMGVACSATKLYLVEPWSHARRALYRGPVADLRMIPDLTLRHLQLFQRLRFHPPVPARLSSGYPQRSSSSRSFEAPRTQPPPVAITLYSSAVPPDQILTCLL